MNFYVASKFENKKAVRNAINCLEPYGHHVTYDWTVSETISPLQAQRDLHGVLTADFTVVLLNYPTSDLICNCGTGWEQATQYKGTLIELGAALAMGQFVFILGDYLDGHVFYELPQVVRINELMDVVRFFR